MSLGRSKAVVTIDLPGAEGITAAGGRGIMRQFRFNDRDTGDPDIFATHPVGEWSYASGGYYNVAPIPALRACGPRPILTPVDCIIGQGWEATNSQSLPNCSNWWTATYSGGPALLDGGLSRPAWYLHYADGRGAYDASTGYFGEVTADGLFHADPNLVIRVGRSAPAATLPLGCYTYVEVQLLGDGETGQWSLVLPKASLEGFGLYPRLGWRQRSTDDWQVIREVKGQKAEAWGKQDKATEQFVLWETIDRHFLLNLDGEEVVYYIPDDRLAHPSDYAVAGGPVRVIVYGHQALVNVSPINYASHHGYIGGEETGVPVSVKQAKVYKVDTTLYKAATDGAPDMLLPLTAPEGYWAPRGCIVDVRDDVFQSSELAEDWHEISVTFKSPSPRRRGVIYVAGFDMTPTIGAGVSDPWTSAGKDVVISANGSCSLDWRNAECTVELEVERTDADTLMATWTGNNPLAVDAGWSAGVDDVVRQFTGYMGSVSPLREGERPEVSRVTVRGRDGFMRLERKFWKDLGSFAGRDLSDTFHRVLNQCGIPDSKITATEAEGIIVPPSRRLADTRFDFPEDQDVIGGLDQTTAACGFAWGVDQTGQWFCRKPLTYTTGTAVDFLIDDDTVSESGFVFKLKSETLFEQARDGRPFVNCVFVRIDRGSEQEEVLRIFDASWHDDEDPAFIGDDWWHIFIGYDEAAAAALAERLLNDRKQRSRMIHFWPNGQPSLFPGMWVGVDATGINVPPASPDPVFQVVTKHWACTEDLRFTTDFDLRFVQ